ncbi:hypothetical protein BJ322DRAFT_736201 [Thelephora terrestris]|uniref:Uncharacterized protein n=1 Tax=Thelephora terrestris TaxID=56493 RepID=A0A9P6L6M7_9AGAM|nr:hypothetical protein BJ322DRAFT_736201 [Thelephora terrestris]
MPRTIKAIGWVPLKPRNAGVRNHARPMRRLATSAGTTKASGYGCPTHCSRRWMRYEERIASRVVHCLSVGCWMLKPTSLRSSVRGWGLCLTAQLPRPRCFRGNRRRRDAPGIFKYLKTFVIFVGCPRRSKLGCLTSPPVTASGSCGLLEETRCLRPFTRGQRMGSRQEGFEGI